MSNNNLEKNRNMKTFEERYKEVFSPQHSDQVIPDNETLEQPSPLITVDSFTTYGVFEKPIMYK